MPETHHPIELIILSGRSGSGKSIALHVLEDIGYYCIDNLPLGFLVDLHQKIGSHNQKVAISIDARNVTSELKNFNSIVTSLKKHFNCEIIFLDADNNTLLMRFSETRRKHPLTNKSTRLKEALEMERLLLKSISDHADLLVDTSHLNIRELNDLIQKRMSNEEDGLSILFQSFGFKHGTPRDTDFIFDTRCLPNPYWEKNIRHKTGMDQAVIDFLEKFKEVDEMYEAIRHFIEKWLPSFEAENRRYLTISLGCTGGRHRSVYLIEKLGKYFIQKHKNVAIRHRDLL